MSRLIDDIKFPVYGSFSDIDSEIPGAVVFQIQNVADYHWRERVDWYEWKDFPNMAPPFPKMWFEYRQPRYMYVGKDDPVLIDKRGQIVEGPPEERSVRIGIFVLSTRIDDDKSNASIISALDHGAGVYQNMLGKLDTPYWIMSFYTYVYSDTGTSYYGGKVTLGVSDKGICATPLSVLEIPQWLRKYDADDRKADQMNGIIRPIALALSLLHCKNVTMIVNEPPAKVQSRRVKDGKLPLTRYHTLNIEPMQKILRHEGQSEKIGLKMALHICRGHFKDYSKGKGLFGKFHDLYWWESMVRGNAEHGTVVKDYNVNKPVEAQ